MAEQARNIGLFVHIEKTAGTSVRAALESAVGTEHVLIYHPKADRLSRSSDGLHPTTSPRVDKVVSAFSNPVLAPALAKLFPLAAHVYDWRVRRRYPTLEVPKDAKVIFGHFTADKFNDQVSSPISAVVLREPLNRMRSHYDHWRRKSGALDWRVRVPFDRDLTFEEFAMLPELQSYQAQALAGKDLSEFAAVGTTDDIDTFTANMLEVFSSGGLCDPVDKSTLQVKRMNATNPRRRTTSHEGNSSFQLAFSRFHEQDYEIYSRAQAMTSQR